MSYTLGSWLGSRMRDHWPFKSKPELFERAHAVFERYGIVAVCIGYFIGPLRGPIPVAAGIAGMPYVQFHLASVLAAAIWTLTVIAPGAILHQSFGPNDPILLLASLLVAVVTVEVAGGIIVLRRALNRTNPQRLRRLFNRLLNPSKAGIGCTFLRTIEIVPQPDSEKPQRDQHEFWVGQQNLEELCLSNQM